MPHLPHVMPRPRSRVADKVLIQDLVVERGSRLRREGDEMKCREREGSSENFDGDVVVVQYADSIFWLDKVAIRGFRGAVDLSQSNSQGSKP